MWATRRCRAHHYPPIQLQRRVAHTRCGTSALSTFRLRWKEMECTSDGTRPLTTRLATATHRIGWTRRWISTQALVNKGRLFRPSEANTRQTGGKKANIKPCSHAPPTPPAEDAAASLVAAAPAVIMVQLVSVLPLQCCTSGGALVCGCLPLATATAQKCAQLHDGVSLTAARLQERPKCAFRRGYAPRGGGLIDAYDGQTDRQRRFRDHLVCTVARQRPRYQGVQRSCTSWPKLY